MTGITNDILSFLCTSPLITSGRLSTCLLLILSHLLNMKASLKFPCNRTPKKFVCYLRLRTGKNANGVHAAGYHLIILNNGESDSKSKVQLSLSFSL